MEKHFLLCDKYFVENTKDQSKPKRLIAIYSFNEYGDQGKDKYTFHVQGKNGIELIPGNQANLIPLKWYQKDTYKAGILGGIIGFLLSLALQWLQIYFSFN